MNEQPVAQFIIEITKREPFILGSQLGAEVKKQFPWFRGLRNFIDQFCGNQVVCLGKRGIDYVYAHASQTNVQLAGSSGFGSVPSQQVSLPAPIAQQTPSTLGIASPPPRLSPAQQVAFTPTLDTRASVSTFWQAFTNPNTMYRLALEQTAMDLRVFGREAEIKPPFLEVRKVSGEEHKRIVNDFLQFIDVNERPQFQAVAAGYNPWPEWSQLTKNYQGGKYFEAWLNFRTDALRKLFEERLAALGIQPSVFPLIAGRLLESKRHRVTKLGPSILAGANGLEQRRVRSKRCELTENELRQFAITAVSQMGANELRRIWFPLGVIMDALNER